MLFNIIIILKVDRVPNESVVNAKRLLDEWFSAAETILASEQLHQIDSLEIIEEKFAHLKVIVCVWWWIVNYILQELQVQHRSHEKTLQFIDESLKQQSITNDDHLQCLRKRFIIVIMLFEYNSFFLVGQMLRRT